MVFFWIIAILLVYFFIIMMENIIKLIGLIIIALALFIISLIVRIKDEESLKKIKRKKR